MSISISDDGFSAPPEAPKGVAWLAWVVIVVTVLFIVFRETIALDAHGEDPPVSLVVAKMQARYLVGAAHAVGKEEQKLYEQAVSTLNHGPPLQRLVFVTVAGELAGPAEALRRLAELEALMDAHPREVTKEERRLSELLERLYRRQVGLEGRALAENEQRFLRDRLEWFAELALHPKAVADNAAVAAVAGEAARVPLAVQEDETRAQVLEPADRTFLLLFGGVSAGMFLAFLGLALLVLFLVLAIKGELEDGIQIGLPHGGVYAETFAWWLVGFLGLSWAAGQIADDVPRLVKMGLAMFASLLALVWPWLRGIPWQQIRRDIGWTLGRNPPLEPFLGPVAYAISLPMVAVGAMAALVIVVVQSALSQGEAAADPFSGAGSPINPHPIVQFLVEGDWSVWMQVLFLASVAAPIVEETMFRGVLYRHLREATRRAPLVLSIFSSAVIASFIFAVIHPTGLVAVPLLMALAFGFTLAREWRGTLIPCVIAHGLSNGLVTLLVIAALGK